MNAAILEAINATGEAFLIHTELGGEFTMRLAIGATNQQVRWQRLCKSMKLALLGFLVICASRLCCHRTAHMCPNVQKHDGCVFLS